MDKKYALQDLDYSEPLPFPSHLDLEINSRCNYFCSYCPQSLPKKQQGFSQGTMSLDSATRIIQYCAENGTKTIKPFWRGEPTINKDLPKILKIAKSAGISTMINTNGSFPLKNDKRVADYLDWISFSLDKYHKKNIDSDDILKRVLFFKYMGVRTEIQSSSPNKHLKDFCKHFDIKLKIDEITKRTDTGNYKFLNLKDYPRKNCKFPFWRMIITWDLKVKPCCVAWKDTELVMGSLKRKSELRVEYIKYAWNSVAYDNLRKDQLKKSYDHEACQNCVSSAGYDLTVNELTKDMKDTAKEVKTWPKWEQNSMKEGEFSR